MERLGKIRLLNSRAQSLEEEIAERQQNEELMEQEGEEEKKEKNKFLEIFSPIKEKLKLKPFPWKAINTKNMLIAGCLVLIAIAGYLNIRFATTTDTNVPDPAATEGNVDVENETESYFTSAIINRERARDEAIEVLMSITEDEQASQESRASAYVEMERIANETSSEINIENLIKAKGFEECVAVVSNESCNIVVKSQGLTPSDVAQIKEIVYLEANILPKNIKIIEKN